MADPGDHPGRPAPTGARAGIRIEGLRRRRGRGDTAVDALKDVNRVVSVDEVVGLAGPSGSGKSARPKCLGAVVDPRGAHGPGWAVDPRPARAVAVCPLPALP